MKKKIILILIFVLCVGFVAFEAPYFFSRRLTSAVRKNDLKAAERWLSVGVNPNYPEHPATGIWHYLNVMVEFCPDDPLSVACHNGNIEMVKLLLDNGATPQQTRNPGSWSPLATTLFYFQKKDTEIVRLLIDAGADLNVEENGKTPLEMAIEMYPRKYDPQRSAGKALENEYDEETANGITEIVQLLIEKQSFDVHNDGKTFLSIAAKKGNLSLVKYLISIGADKTFTDSDGKTAYDYAVENGYIELSELLKP